MTFLTSDEQCIARAAIEENRRLNMLIFESTESQHGNDDTEEEKKVDSIYSLQRRNELLRGDVNDLQNQLMQCETCSLDVVSRFNRLNAKRANLRNETQSLRNIVMHQAPKVREAQRIERERQEMKKTSDEKNKEAKDESKRLRDRREKEIALVSVLLRRETLLREQLEEYLLPSQLNDRHIVRNVIAIKDKKIRKIEGDIKAVRNSQLRSQYIKRGEFQDDVEKLKEEYHLLREKLAALRQELKII
ncbi:hypothetical protein ERJ75_000968300 [Trypanosoma vivax]|uniref:DUF4201 domain-containing protein n=1 Tax=Trypanosoma vivax (strain Y486) TaxID=1055687 RepID=G0U6F0_TRYVY|nr:hypothetical protein TRVL_08296 [Trypanosoma vivax]KAH8611276.1 hypothetical protein ERJ75_000968300 [Trypanosoma vivax]CCC51454.1 conserved hypothetical protein [Trypanosoma vivax Y486]